MRAGCRSVIAVLILLLLASPPGFALAAESAADLVGIQVLTVNDFHGALSENGLNPGAAKLAGVIRAAKDKNPVGTLILSAGDMFQGTPDSNLLGGKPVVAVMNAVGFDAMALGNHEFDWGIGVLKERIGESTFPYLAANVVDKATNQVAAFVRPYSILERCGVKIAVIGLSTPETAYKSDAKTVAAFIFQDPSATVHALLPELERQKVDVIIALTHLAAYQDSDGTISDDAAVLAAREPALAAVVSGHSHQTVAGKVAGIPVVQAWYSGRAVGEIELIYKKSTHQVIFSTATVMKVTVEGAPSDPVVAALVAKAGQEVAPVKNRLMGKTTVRLDHDREGQESSLLGQWTTDRMREAAGADIAFENAGGLRTAIPAGDITMGNFYEVLPFDNTLVTVDMTGAQIMKVLQHGLPGGKFGMVQFSGIKVAWDSSLPAEGRILAVTLPDGTPLAADRSYRVVTNDFMAAGGDGFTMFREGQNMVDTNMPLRNVLADYLQKTPLISPLLDDRCTDVRQAKLPLAA
ncbi:MAG: 5'-nucleotidase C-terminal domain-containing protein [Negativicutes bacterium]|nr:5'-nucleotidase C-terminal domain-containing protein [Negativicutes bacterium]